jgi:hypothetical protein
MGKALTAYDTPNFVAASSMAGRCSRGADVPSCIPGNTGSPKGESSS